MSLSTLTKNVPQIFNRKGPMDSGLKMFSSSEESGGLEKWQIALLLGSPIVVGAAAYYFYFRKSSDKDDEKHTHLNKSRKNVTPKEKPIPTDPHQKAIYYKEQGNQFYRRGAYEQAIEAYSQAITCCPDGESTDLSTFYQNIAACYQMLKNHEKVIEECSKAIKLNKKYTKALFRRARAYEAVDKLTEALNDLTIVNILDKFSNKNALLETDQVLKRLSKIKAEEYFGNKSPKMPSKYHIKTQFTSYRRNPFPSDVEASEEGLQSFLASLEEKREEEGVAAMIQLLKGTIEYIKGDIKKATTELLPILDMENVENDIKVNALIKLGKIKVQSLEETEEVKGAALQCFERAIEIDPDNQDIYINRAQFYIIIGKVEDGLADLEKCCELDPEYPSAVSQKLYVQFRSAVELQNRERAQETIEEFEKASERFPKSSEVFSLYAQALMEQFEFEKAEKMFQKASEADPEDASIFVHRALLHVNSKLDFEKAKELINNALKIDNKCQFAYEMLGTIEGQQGNLKKAIEYFDQAIEIANSLADCIHLFSMKEAAMAQLCADEILNSRSSSNTDVQK